MNVTVSHIQDKVTKSFVILPCISKKISGEVQLFRVDDKQEKESAQYNNMRYDPFAGFVIPQGSVLPQFNGTRILRHECRFISTNTTLIRINLILESGTRLYAAAKQQSKADNFKDFNVF